MEPTPSFTVFHGPDRIAHGDLAAAAHAAHQALPHSVIVFDDSSGARVDLDLRLGAEAAAAAHLDQIRPPPLQPQGRGRPKLGVTPREVTLLPRHWDWLARQSGGASAALRRLVEDALRADDAPLRAREAREAAYRVMSALAGNLPGFEEACRTLFAGRDADFDEIIAGWPADVAAYVRSFGRAERGISVCV
jgi:uncharacterized protein